MSIAAFPPKNEGVVPAPPPRHAVARGVSDKRATSSYHGGETTNAANLIQGLYASYQPLSYQLPWQTLEYVELLSTYNPDYSQAVENIKMLANSGHTLFVESKSKLRQRRVKAFLLEAAKNLQEQHGGIDGIIDKLLDQAAVFGAMCGEIVLSDDLRSVVDFVDLSPKKIRFFWDEREGRFRPFQKVSAAQLEEAKDKGQYVLNGCVLLNEETFRYYAFDAAPESPYGTPPFLAALANIAIQRDLTTNMAQIVKKIGLLGIVDLSIERLSMKPNESDGEYAARATAYLDAYVKAAEDMAREGGLVHFDDVTASTYQIAGNAAGATNIHKANEEMIFSGLKSMPSVQGRCVVPETLVLRSDLRWVPAGELEMGEELIGFDEDLGKNRGHGAVARMKPSTVECVDRIELPCVRIVTDKGEITVSENHPMVALGNRMQGRIWKNGEDILAGDKLIWFCEPWEEEDSYDAGYLAGMFDGEATLGFHGSGKNGTLTFSQLEGVVLDETVLAMKRLGFSAYVGAPTGGTHKNVCHVRLLGGKWETLRFLGSVRPHRLVAKARQCWNGASLRNGGSVNQTARKEAYANVIAVHSVGLREVVALQTSSRTFFSEGMLSHNSYSTTETYAGVAYDIIIRNTQKYQRACKRMIEAIYWKILLLSGEDMPDGLRIEFAENRSLNRLQEASAVKIEIANAGMKWLMGIIDQTGVAQELGYSEPKIPLEEVPEAVTGAATAHAVGEPTVSTVPNPSQTMIGDDDEAED